MRQTFVALGQANLTPRAAIPWNCRSCGPAGDGALHAPLAQFADLVSDATVSFRRRGFRRAERIARRISREAPLNAHD